VVTRVADGMPHGHAVLVRVLEVNAAENPAPTSLGSRAGEAVETARDAQQMTLLAEKARSPKWVVSTSAATPLKAAWPETYSGWFGVARNGDQPGSAVVAALPSASASWITVIGRQAP
jgi:hypothetical protein